MHSLSRAWGMNGIMMPKLCVMDFKGFHFGRMTALIECRRRNCNRDKYPDILLKPDKVKNMRAMSQAYGVEAIFSVRFDDALCYANITDKKYAVRMGGGYDRHPKDREPCARIPSEDFKTVFINEKSMPTSLFVEEQTDLDHDPCLRCPVRGVRNCFGIGVLRG